MLKLRQAEAHTTHSIGGKVERDWEIKLKWCKNISRYEVHVWIPKYNHWIHWYIAKEMVKELTDMLDTLYEVGGEE